MTTSPAPTALVIRANGHIEIVPNKGLASLQKAVGGLIEPINLGRDAVMYVNEEGLLNSLPLNVVATQIVRHEYPLWSRFAGLWGWPHAHPGPIVGDVVIVVVDPETGEYGDHPYLLEEAAVFLSGSYPHYAKDEPEDIDRCLQEPENDRFISYWSDW